jgi:hypothetical protein
MFLDLSTTFFKRLIFRGYHGTQKVHVVPPITLGGLTTWNDDSDPPQSPTADWKNHRSEFSIRRPETHEKNYARRS